MPTEVANRDFWANKMSEQIDTIDLPFRQPEVLEKLKAISTKPTSSKRNLPHICSFFVQGKCNRGAACPYRHDNITEEELEAMQKGQRKVEDQIKDRYAGIDDPLAEKIASKVKTSK